MVKTTKYKMKTKKDKTTKKNNKNKKKDEQIFNESNYNDKNGMLTYLWGPPLWFFLHTMSFNYPILPTQEQKTHHKQFIENLQYILPCKYCRINLINNFKKNPITEKHLENRENFSKYIYDLHNIVNKMLDKKFEKSYEEVRNMYENFRSTCLLDKGKIFDFKKMHKKGCTEPIIGRKSKCVLRIIPKEDKTETLKVSNKCLKRKW
jgi:hypothetical protein